MAERDLDLLSSICEPGLRSAFTDFFDALDEEDCQVMAPESKRTDESNDDELSTDLLDLEIIDFHMLYGNIFMSREDCRRHGLYEFPYLK